MPICRCQYNGCNGTNVARSTKDEHEKKDRSVRLKASLGLSASSHTHPLVQTSTPAGPPLPPSFAISDTSHVHEFESSDVPSSLNVPSFTADPSAALDAQTRKLRKLEAAEERGRMYADRVSSNIELFDDLGDLEEDNDVDAGGEPQQDPGPETPADKDSMEVKQQPLHTPTLRSLESLPLHVAPDADPRFLNENSPDPFYMPATSMLPPSITPANTYTPWYILYMLVVWLHAQCKLAFLACDAVMVVITHIVLADRANHDDAGVGFEDDRQAPYATLKTILNNMGVEPNFQVLPVCPQCSEPHPAGRSHTSTCNRCEAPLFKPLKTNGRRTGSAEPNSRPLVQYPSMSIKSQIQAILETPGMEDELEQWRYATQTSGEYHDMFDGRIARNIKACDERPFFENPLPAAISTELQIGLVLGFNWYVTTISSALIY
jgi:hypothetical protein